MVMVTLIMEKMNTIVSEAVTGLRERFLIKDKRMSSLWIENEEEAEFRIDTLSVQNVISDEKYLNCYKNVQNRG